MTNESRRLTHAQIIGQQHEAVMAALTKTPAKSKRWEVTVDQQKIGDLKGQWLGSLTVAPEDDEDWPQFLGRWQTMLDDVQRELVRRNSSLVPLEESVKLAADSKREQANNQALRGRIAAAKSRRP